MMWIKFSLFIEYTRLRVHTWTTDATKAADNNKSEEYAILS